MRVSWATIGGVLPSRAILSPPESKEHGFHIASHRIASPGASPSTQTSRGSLTESTGLVLAHPLPLSHPGRTHSRSTLPARARTVPAESASMACRLS